MSILISKPHITQAIRNITGGQVSFNMDGDEIITWDINNTGIAQPTQSEIDTELASLQKEFDAQDYARKRKAEYPTIEELVVALYDTEDKAAIDEKRAAVKLKHPKGV